MARRPRLFPESGGRRYVRANAAADEIAETRTARDASEAAIDENEDRELDAGRRTAK